jgi:hypothetical protein
LKDIEGGEEDVEGKWEGKEKSGWDLPSVS